MTPSSKLEDTNCQHSSFLAKKCFEAPKIALTSLPENVKLYLFYDRYFCKSLSLFVLVYLYLISDIKLLQEKFQLIF